MFVSVVPQDSWDAAFLSNCLREHEEGTLKLWVKEPTRLRGESGVCKTVGLSVKRTLEDQDRRDSHGPTVHGSVVSVRVGFHGAHSGAPDAMGPSYGHGLAPMRLSFP